MRAQIVVISDCSDDGTDDIVREFASQGVTLARMNDRRGKTAGLNATVPTLSGDIVVFSDANAMYERDALRKLARNFADDTVGYVTGEARYLQSGRGAPPTSANGPTGTTRCSMKRLETQLGSMVGGDGAIYAIRRSLWQTLPEDAINDFLNPLQIVAAGWRGVYEPEAVCWEETAGRVHSEYRRRIRIVSRSWRAVFQAGRVLNPFKVGLFAWSLWSHKVLRWASGLFVGGAVLGAIGLMVQGGYAWPPIAAAFGIAAAALSRSGRRLLTTTGYFAVLNVASLIGMAKGSAGRVSGVWSTPRAAADALKGATGLIPIGRIFLAIVGLVTVVLIVTTVGSGTARAPFWISLAALGYVYAGYPLILMCVKGLRPRPLRKRAIEPTVCVFVAANDEETVIEAKIRNTLALDYPPDHLDIVVASDGSVDGTNAIVRRFAPRVRLLEFSPRQGKMDAINRGMPAVTAEILVLSDANTFLQPSAIRALVANFADDSVGAVSGDVRLVGERASLAGSGGSVLPLRALGSAGRIGHRLPDWGGWRALRPSATAVRGPSRRHHSG